MLRKATPVKDALTKKEGEHETKRMTSVGVNMADLTNDPKDRRHSDARASDLAGARNRSMSIAKGDHPDDFDERPSSAVHQ